MELDETLAVLTKHSLFKEWHVKNHDYFLAHAFVMLDEPNKNNWQIGFYNPAKERMVTFIISTTVQKTEEQEVLKAEGEIKQLKPEEVKLSVEQAIKKANECMHENYRAEKPIKQFFIIQNAEGRTMFNITYLMQSLKTLNIKIDAKTGETVKHSLQSLVDFSPAPNGKLPL